MSNRIRQGDIGNPPVEESTFDCVISNGVINLSPDKPAVFTAGVTSVSLPSQRR